MPDSKSGSKTDLNESNMPLLEGEAQAAADAKAEEAGEKVELQEKEDVGKEKDKKKKGNYKEHAK